MKVKGLIFYCNLLCFAGYGQIKKLSAWPENFSTSSQFILFQVTKEIQYSEVIWNNYFQQNEINDSAYYDLSSVKIKCKVIYALTLDTIKTEPFIFMNSNNSIVTDKIIILPYEKFQTGMSFLISLTDTISLKQMEITVKIDSLDIDSPGDRTFCLNYIPFLNGSYCFTGKDIEHWDVQTANINPNNIWLPCQRFLDMPQKRKKTKHKKQ